MAVTQNSYTGNGSTTTYSFTFPYLKAADVKAQIDTVVTTAFTLPTATTLQFNTAPGNGAKIKIYRETDDDALTATFYAGSAIKSEDLNDNFTQNLYTTQEVNARFLSNLGGTMVGDLTMGEDAEIHFEGATDNTYETTLTVTDPTADRTITLPNVTGTVVTTGDTATVTATMLAANSVDSSELVDGSIDTSHIADGQVTTAKLAADAVTGAKIADDAINSEHYVDASIDTAHIADSQVTTAKIANDAVTAAKIAADAVGSSEIAANAVGASELADDAVDTAAIANNAVTNAKMADDSVGADELVDGSVGAAALASNAVTLAKMADSSVGTSELVDDAVTTAKIADNAVTAAKIPNSGITTAKINNDAINSDKIADDAVTTDHIADAELVTLAGMQSGTASVLASATALTATTGQINGICTDTVKDTSIGSNSSHGGLATGQAVREYVSSQIAPIGGLEVIENKDSFPETIPIAGVVVSIENANGIVVNGSGTSTTPDTITSNATVTINQFPADLQSTTIANGVGLMVQSTGASHTYNYHKALLKEADLVNLSNDINDFGNRYRVNAGEPSSNNDEGDLVYDTNANKMKVYDGSSWGEVTSTGDFKFLVPVDAGTTTAATWDGSDTSFDLKEGTNSGSAASVTSVYQLMISVNGVIQKPNTGSWSGSGEGFYLTDSDTIRFATAPPTGSSVFIIQFGSALSATTPADNTVATAKIQNGAVTTAKLGADAVDGTKIADDAINSEHYTDGSIDLAHMSANSVDSDQYVDGSIDTAHIADLQVTTAKIAADAITGAKVADDAIDSEHFVDGSIDTAHIADDAVTSAKIADDAVVQAAIADASIDEARLQISNSPTNGYALTAQSGNTGGLTWAEVGGGVTSDAQNNTLAGTNAGASFSGTDATNNTLIGYNAGGAITTGDNNVALGLNALDATNTGSANIAIGPSALGANTTAAANIAVGYNAMQDNQDGAENTAAGHEALANHTTADNNTAFGCRAMLGSASTAGTGGHNTAIGHSAMRSVESNCESSVAVGANSMRLLTTGSKNTAVGYNALYSNLTSNENTAVGFKALENNTTTFNTAVGAYALDSCTTGSANTAVGHNAAQTAQTAEGICAFGYYTLYNCTGTGNVAVGKAAGKTVTTGTNNVFIGTEAGDLKETASLANVAVGAYSFGGGGESEGNTCVGMSSGGALSTGDNNICVGRTAGSYMTTGSNNIFIGFGTGMLGSPTGVFDTDSNTLSLGNNSISDFYCADTSISSSDKRDKTDIAEWTHGLDWINKLKPVTYRWDKRSFYSDDYSVTPDGSKKWARQHLGFLAQDVLEVEQSFGYASKKDDMLTVNINCDDTSYGMKYERLVVVLTKAVQELSAKNDALEARIAALEAA